MLCWSNYYSSWLFSLTFLVSLASVKFLNNMDVNSIKSIRSVCWPLVFCRIKRVLHNTHARCTRAVITADTHARCTRAVITAVSSAVILQPCVHYSRATTTKQLANKLEIKFKARPGI